MHIAYLVLRPKALATLRFLCRALSAAAGHGDPAPGATRHAEAWRHWWSWSFSTAETPRDVASEFGFSLLPAALLTDIAREREEPQDE